MFFHKSQDEVLDSDCTVGLVNLNILFDDSDNQLVYVASEEDERINQFLRDNLPSFNKRFSSSNKHFIYLPSLVEQLKDEDIIRYRAPYHVEESLDEKIGNDYMLQFFSPDSRTRIRQGLLWLKLNDETFGTLGPDSHPLLYEFFPLSSDSKMSLALQLRMILVEVHRRDVGEAEDRFCGCELISDDEPEDYADEEFNSQEDEENIDDLLDEVRERVERLRKRGIAEHILLKIIQPEEKLSRMVINRDYRIVLPDYQNMEIKMEPLVKAVYLLFLNHPEGIMFKELPDYRKELTEIYIRLKPKGLTDRACQSIEDVTNPCKNSINEKCARIREAFVGQFDNHLARHYYIDGERAKPKKIGLSRELVVWEK